MLDLVLDCRGGRWHVAQSKSKKVIDAGTLAGLGLDPQDDLLCFPGADGSARMTMVREAGAYWLCIGDGETCAEVRGPFAQEETLLREVVMETDRLSEAYKVALVSLFERPLWSEYRRRFSESSKGGGGVRRLALPFCVRNKNAPVCGHYLVTLGSDRSLQVEASRVKTLSVGKRPAGTAADTSCETALARVNYLVRKCAQRLAPGLDLSFKARDPVLGTSQVQAVPQMNMRALRALPPPVKNCVVDYAAALCTAHGFALAGPSEV